MSLENKDFERYLIAFAVHAPNPTGEAIGFEAEADRLANPHNDPGKRRRRSHNEIIAKLKFDYAAAMMKEFNDRTNRRG
jgi:hypothetical protein